MGNFFTVDHSFTVPYDQYTSKICMLCNNKKIKNDDLIILNIIYYGNKNDNIGGELLLRCSHGHILKYRSHDYKHILYCANEIKNKKNEESQSEIDKLKNQIIELKNQIIKLKNQIENIKNNVSYEKENIPTAPLEINNNNLNMINDDNIQTVEAKLIL